MKHENRSLYGLILLLLVLVFPIVYENFRHWPATGLLGQILMVFGLELSGLLLIAYSFLVYLFSNVKGKEILSAIALLIGLPWVVYMMYLMSGGIN